MEYECLKFYRYIVKYLAYLRKMTRYNPTRGGKSIDNTSTQFFVQLYDE